MNPRARVLAGPSAPVWTGPGGAPSWSLGLRVGVAVLGIEYVSHSSHTHLGDLTKTDDEAVWNLVSEQPFAFGEHSCGNVLWLKVSVGT